MLMRVGPKGIPSDITHAFPKADPLLSRRVIGLGQVVDAALIPKTCPFLGCPLSPYINKSLVSPLLRSLALV